MKTRFLTFIILTAVAALLAASCGDSLENISDPTQPLLVSASFTDAAAAEPTSTTKARGIYVIGGAANKDGTGVYPQIDMYDPQTDTWYSDIASGATGTYTPTIFNSAAYLNGKIYVMGGAVSSAATTFAVYEYDIANNIWTTKENIMNTGIDTAMMDMAVYTYLDNVYLMGGTTTTTTAGVATAYHLKFDPDAGANGTWYNTPPAPIASARSSIRAAYVGGIAYYYGGRNAAGISQTTNDGYIFATNLFTAAVEPVIVARGGFATASYEGTNGVYIFIVGGATSMSTPNAYFGAGVNATYVAAVSSFQIYPPQGAAITPGKFYPAFSGGTTTGIVFAGAAVSNYNGSTATDPTLYVFGGVKNQNTVTNEVWSITANTTLGAYLTATWYSKTVMPRARYGHSVVIAR